MYVPRAVSTDKILCFMDTSVVTLINVLFSISECVMLCPCVCSYHSVCVCAFFKGENRELDVFCVFMLSEVR